MDLKFTTQATHVLCRPCGGTGHVDIIGTSGKASAMCFHCKATGFLEVATEPPKTSAWERLMGKD